MNASEKARQEAEMWKKRLASAIKNVPPPWNPTEDERAHIAYLQRQAQMAIREYHVCCAQGLPDCE